MSTTQDRLRQAARFTRLDADRELLTEAADALDRREAVIRLLEGEVALAAPGVQEFSRIAKRKLTELQGEGFSITGYAIQRGPVRGFIDGGGFVGWWQGEPAQGAPDDDDLVSMLAQCRDAAARLAPGVAEVFFMQAIGGPCEVPGYIEAVIAELARDAERYRFLAEKCRSTSEHWGGRWSIVIEGPAPKSHDSEDDLDEAIDAAMTASRSQEGKA